MGSSPGQRLRQAVASEVPLQIVGVVNAYCARLAEHVGFGALYLSGAGVANASYGLPDLGYTSRDDVLTDVRRITDTTELPLLVDADTGWGDPPEVGRTVNAMIDAGAAGLHLEDQVAAKRCGHRPGKVLVPAAEMVARLTDAVGARRDSDFVIMARTDAAAVEGLDAAIARARAYVDAGADAIFAEALTELDHFRQFSEAVTVPILANMTEFGRTPGFTLEQLRAAGVGWVLYPLSAFRAMSAAALKVYEAVRRDGTQQAVLDLMQTRQELYDHLDYHMHEQQLDTLRSSEVPDER